MSPTPTLPSRTCQHLYGSGSRPNQVNISHLRVSWVSSLSVWMVLNNFYLDVNYVIYIFCWYLLPSNFFFHCCFVLILNSLKIYIYTLNIPNIFKFLYFLVENFFIIKKYSLKIIYVLKYFCLVVGLLLTIDLVAEYISVNSAIIENLLSILRVTVVLKTKYHWIKNVENFTLSSTSQQFKVFKWNQLFIGLL